MSADLSGIHPDELIKVLQEKGYTVTKPNNGNVEIIVTGSKLSGKELIALYILEALLTIKAVTSLTPFPSVLNLHLDSTKINVNIEDELYRDIHKIHSPDSITVGIQMREESSLSINEKDIKWIVFDDGDLGVMINGTVYTMYKGESLKRTNGKWRYINRDDFGHSCHTKNAHPDDGHQWFKIGNY